VLLESVVFFVVVLKKFVHPKKESGHIMLYFCGQVKTLYKAQLFDLDQSRFYLIHYLMVI
jgi:hypothetical protein